MMVEAGRLTLIPSMRNTPEYVSEADLLEGCRRREIRAFEALYRQYGGRLKSIAYHVAGNRQDAEDAVQETFLKLYRAIEGFRGEASIGTWLCRIVINVCYDIARKRKHETELTEAPERRQASAGMKVALEDALRRINQRHRMVFLLFEIEGLRHSEIAAVLEIPEGTSKAWLFEAKKELKQLLRETKR
jgi:RNA polymerase sigma-70 factor (ECF subfamily)